MQLSAQIQPFLDYLKYEKRYSSHTLVSYQTDLRDFFDFLARQYGEMPLQEVTHYIVRGWLAGLKEQGLASKSLNRKISSLRSFFKHQLRMGNISISPMTNVISPKNGKR